MKITTIREQDERLDFARWAAKQFADNTKLHTVTAGHVAPGCFFGVRWGSANDCVLVLKLDEYFEPTVYGQAITEAGSRNEANSQEREQPVISEQAFLREVYEGGF